MRKILLFFSVFLASLSQAYAAATLMDVYKQALISDPIFQQAIAQQLSDKEGVPISMSALLPSLGFSATPVVSHSNSSGTSSGIAGSNTQRGYSYTLTLNQTIFDFGKFAQVAGARSLSKQADATLSAAYQDLMMRVTKAYLAVLYAEDSVNYTVAAKKAYAKQLDQVTQQYKVGLKTVTDVYTAKASYSSSDAAYIAALNQLANEKENLRAITGVLYPQLSRLREDLPLVSPTPVNVETWVETAQRQNWSIKAAQYAAAAARQRVKQQFAGNLPSLQAQGSYDVNFSRTITRDIAGSIANDSSVPDTSNSFALRGSNQTATSAAAVVLSIPLMQGGYVVASTRKAQYDFQVAMNMLEQQIRSTINMTRQSYSGILASVSKISADKETIKSTISSLDGLKAAYEVGTGTLVDVVNQQQRVVLAQQEYARDRYAYVNNYVALKAAAGTLSYKDMVSLNIG